MEMNEADKMIEKGKEMLQLLSEGKSLDSEEFNSLITALKQTIKSNPRSHRKGWYVLSKPYL